jgi:hypothetical protein
MPRIEPDLVVITVEYIQNTSVKVRLILLLPQSGMHSVYYLRHVHKLQSSLITHSVFSAQKTNTETLVKIKISYPIFIQINQKCNRFFLSVWSLSLGIFVLLGLILTAY